MASRTTFRGYGCLTIGTRPTGRRSMSLDPMMNERRNDARMECGAVVSRGKTHKGRSFLSLENAKAFRTALRVSLQILFECARENGSIIEERTKENGVC
eukprot:scaffold13796_cov137-Amphora_coffeaeformis.AAC.1